MVMTIFNNPIGKLEVDARSAKPRCISVGRQTKDAQTGDDNPIINSVEVTTMMPREFSWTREALI